MLGKFLNKSPLWQHADPAQRLLGVAQLEAGAPALVGLLDDVAPKVREAALARLSDLTTLAERLASHPTENDVRSRLLDLLAAAEPSVRDATLEKLGDESAMAAIATTGPTAAVRMAAAQRVHTTTGLTQLADDARSKDHGVAKYARERLQTIEGQAGREAEAAAICAALDAAADTPGAILSRVVELDRRYAALGADAPHAEAFALARAKVHARLQSEEAAQRERQVWTKDFNALKATEQNAEMSQATLDSAKAMYADLETRAAAHADLLDRLHNSGARTAIEFLERALAGQALADEVLTTFAQPVESAERVVEIEDRWNAVPAEGRDEQRQQRFDDLLRGHRRQLAAQSAADSATQGEARQKLHTLLAQAEEALTAGEIQNAAKLRDEMKPLRATAGELPKPTNQRLGRISQQLGDLLRWQAFGNATQREEMCGQAEQIPQLGLGVGELAKRVQALRDSWKQLDQTQAPAPRTLWERFNAACEIAYAPAAEHFAKQAETRKEALLRREAAIKEISDYAALALTPNADAPDWAPDWRAIASHLSKADTAWRTLGHVDRRKIESVDAKWDAATQPLRAGIKGAQGGEVAERDRLIANVKALVGTDGKLAGGAVAKVKEAQTAWQHRAKSFPLPRKQEQTLWETFRASCNSVFDTLGAEKSARSSAFGEAVGQRNALIDQYAALAQGGDEKAIRAAIADAPKQWARMGDAGRENERKLADRFDKVLRNLRDALRSTERNKGSLQLEALTAVARACAVLEQAQVLNEAPAAQSVIDEMTKIESLPPAWKQKMLVRRAFAEKPVGDETQRASNVRRMDTQYAALDEKLTALELELNVPSAQISPQQRMQMQVARLANRMKTGTTVSAQERFVEICAQSVGFNALTQDRLEAIARALLSSEKQH